MNENQFNLHCKTHGGGLPVTLEQGAVGSSHFEQELYDNVCAVVGAPEKAPRDTVEEALRETVLPSMDTCWLGCPDPELVLEADLRTGRA